MKNAGKSRTIYQHFLCKDGPLTIGRCISSHVQRSHKELGHTLFVSRGW